MRMYDPAIGPWIVPPEQERVPIRRQRNEPTTGAGNLDLSIADVDSILEQVRGRNHSVTTIADRLDVPVARILQVCSEAGLFVKDVETPTPRRTAP
jgi:hypothetical protein